ncbi:spore germination protein [Paenibacillus cremeus]|uniref:Spore germination protein n=1 Tax=Paenibacillus cremeus TaxID=2163881 RepID=A0A559JSP1_9BACL|nr:spore germination protein [Paenibacillus cremeus]TVY02908.1 spore germination protein [Paenibacillus cremeus]
MGFLRNFLRGKRQAPIMQQANEEVLQRLSMDIDKNLADVKMLFPLTPGLMIREFEIKSTGRRGALVYLDELTDQQMIHHQILSPLMQEQSGDTDVESILSIGMIQRAYDLNQVEKAIVQGKSVLYIDGLNTVMLFHTHGWPKRAIEEPQVEAALKGSHLGFVETSSQNIAMIRRYIPNRELKVKEYRVGIRGEAGVSLLFLADVVNPELVLELETRLQSLDVDAIINTGELEELIEDHPYSPFPQFITTERPDSAASHILQGRIALIMDRSPGALIAPVTFASFFQSVDDYTFSWQVGSFLRLLRFSAFFITIFLPAIYIAVISFNFEIIPLQLLLSIGESRANVPFAPILEALIMEISLEMLKEAGVRLPAPIGQSVGIVGAIIIGQATVQAGLVSNIMVVVVALTGMASFIIPNQDMSTAIRLIRFPMMILAFLFGLLGVGVGLMILLGHLISLQSLSTPYIKLSDPPKFLNLRDSLVRLPLQYVKKRPSSTKPSKVNKQEADHPKGDGG